MEFVLVCCCMLFHNLVISCLEKSLLPQVVKRVARFARKYYASQLLSNRLFGGDSMVQETLAEIRNGPLADDAEMADLVQMEVSHLQQSVRKAMLSDPKISERLREWIQIVVRPALHVSCASVPDRMTDIIARFTAILSGDQASEQDAVNMRLATACIKGDFQSNPFIQGLALACRRKAEKESRGIFTMAGRRDRDTTSKEAELISDAGISLAMACGNVAMAKSFGLSGSSLRINLDELEKHSLPTSALAVLWEDVMKQNWIIADQRFVRHAEEPKRILIGFCRGWRLGFVCMLRIVELNSIDLL